MWDVEIIMLSAALPYSGTCLCVCVSFCLSVIIFVNKISLKVMYWFRWNFAERWAWAWPSEESVRFWWWYVFFRGSKIIFQYSLPLANGKRTKSPGHRPNPLGHNPPGQNSPDKIPLTRKKSPHYYGWFKNLWNKVSCIKLNSWDETLWTTLPTNMNTM